MIDIYEHAFFQNCKCTLKETSKNDAKKDDIKYMTESTLPAINFDKAKENYIKDMKLSSTPLSNDALLLINGELIFIEFKDGYMKNEIYKVKRKIFESLLIVLDVFDKTIKYSRDHISYILVYNEQVNEKYINSIIEDRKMEDAKKLEKNEVLESTAFNLLSKTISNYANYHMDIFGLEKQFKKLYFKDVHTYSKEEFENFLAQETTAVGS